MVKSGRFTMCEAFLYLSRADRLLRLAVSGCLEKYKVTMMEWLLLGVVGDGPAEGQNMSALARQLDLTMPQVTALTSHHLQQKLVKQKAAKHERRNRYVLITGKGRNLLEDVEEDVRTSVYAWLQPIPDDQMANFMDTAVRICHLEEERAAQAEAEETAEPEVTGIQGNLLINVTGEEV